MPTIEITSEQAELLAAGKSISVAPKTRLSIAVHKDGAVYLVEGDPRNCDAYTMLRTAARPVAAARARRTSIDFTSRYTITEVSA